MEAVLKVNPLEFNEVIFQKIRNFAQNGEFGEIVINFLPRKHINSVKQKQTREEYFAELAQSLEDTKNGNLISFTVEEFEEFIKK
jgi:hypothetical protein